jgi:hypothetical protein
VRLGIDAVAIHIDVGLSSSVCHACWLELRRRLRDGGNDARRQIRGVTEWHAMSVSGCEQQVVRGYPELCLRLLPNLRPGVRGYRSDIHCHYSRPCHSVVYDDGAGENVVVNTLESPRQRLLVRGDVNTSCAYAQCSSSRIRGQSAHDQRGEQEALDSHAISTYLLLVQR